MYNRVSTCGSVCLVLSHPPVNVLDPVRRSGGGAHHYLIGPLVSTAVIGWILWQGTRNP